MAEAWTDSHTDIMRHRVRQSTLFLGPVLALLSEESPVRMHTDGESRLGLLQESMQVANQGLEQGSRPGKTTEGAGDSWV